MICLILLISSCQTVIIQLKETKTYNFSELKNQNLSCREIIKIYFFQLNEVISKYEDLKNQIKTADGYKIVVVEE